MVCPLRLELAGAFHHVASRGDREDVYFSVDD